MASREWYRKETWSASDREEFFAKLNRSRSSFNRAQYLRIQASYLQGTKTQKHLKVALELLEILFAQYPEPFELAPAYLQRAQCLLALGHIDASVESFRKAVAREKEFPKSKCDAPLRFGWEVVRRRWTHLYAEADAITVTLGTEFIFPAQDYLWNSIRALILEAKGDMVLAREHARAALQAANRTHSGIQYHPNVGLVGTPDPEIHSKLRKLAST